MPPVWLQLCQNCAKNPSRGFSCARTSFVVRPAIQFRECLALHLQLHLRILLENLRVVLAQELRDPFVGHASGAQASRIRRPQIVGPEVRDLRIPHRGCPDPTPLAVFESGRRSRTTEGGKEQPHRLLHLRCAGARRGQPCSVCDQLQPSDQPAIWTSRRQNYRIGRSSQLDQCRATTPGE